LCEPIKKNKMGWHVAHNGRREVYTEFCRGIQRERDHLEKSDVDGKIKLRWIFRKWYGGPWTGLICLRIRIGGEYL
jgi:hypothetical protein